MRAKVFEFLILPAMVWIHIVAFIMGVTIEAYKLEDDDVKRN